MNLGGRHPNRRSHNWLIYHVGEEWLLRFQNKIRGCVYDLGCGEAPYKQWILNSADQYIGVDWGESIHALNADIIADLNKPLPINSAVADTVISFSVMEHLSEPQVFLNEANRILRIGGEIVLQVPFMWGVHEAPYDFFRYTEFGLKYMFEKAGFTEVKVYPQTGFWTMWILKFNYQTMRLVRGPRWARFLIKLPMTIIWGINQFGASWLDKTWNCTVEPAGYFVVATKRE
jgi:SAM-dependent methyltransferase